VSGFKSFALTPPQAAVVRGCLRQSAKELRMLIRRNGPELQPLLDVTEDLIRRLDVYLGAINPALARKGDLN